MKLIDADVKIHFNVYDEMHEENTLKEMTIIEFLDDFTDEGCPPTVDPVKRGMWNMRSDPYGFFDEIPVCSECGCTNKMRETYRYCPNCGAKMDEVSE